MEEKRRINRRTFLKFVGANLAAGAFSALAYPVLAYPIEWSDRQPILHDWPKLTLESLPQTVRNILSKAPRARVDAGGYLVVPGGAGKPPGRVPLVRTLWNQERSRLRDRLYRHVPWGIVLHWFGERESFEGLIAGYMRGFNSLRETEGYEYRTSAHFLVGDGVPFTSSDPGELLKGILQTQKPDQDGTPFVASHLKMLDLLGHKEHKQYFVRALYQLNYDNPRVHSLLQDLFDGPRFDPNMRTIGIEIAGYDFDNPEHMPSEQKIANVVGLVWALMKRYGIPASHLMGHNEIQLGKSDPGKKFLALIRYLVGVKALLENDGPMKMQVFGQYLIPGGDPAEAVRQYFSFVRDYFVLVGTPRRVYEWDEITRYWYLAALVQGTAHRYGQVSNWLAPIQGAITNYGFSYLDPTNHEGIDLCSDGIVKRTETETTIHLAADGECMYTGITAGSRIGEMAIFRHRPLDGAELLTVYGHLNGLGDVRVGAHYPQGFTLGAIEKRVGYRTPFLHFAVAYGATWTTDLSKHPVIPLNVGPTWIGDRYLNPGAYLEGHV